MADSPALVEFVERLNGGHVTGSLELSRQTVHVLARLIRESSAHSVGGLLDLVRSAGHVMIRAKPQELVLGNIVRRILSIIREAHAEDAEDDALQSGYDDRDDHAKLTARLTEETRETIAMEITDLFGELDLTLSNVKQYALDHIHSNEVVLTFGESNSVASFLIAGGRSRNLSVIVAESGPNRYGAEMCAKLARHGIRTTLVPDSHVHAVMPTVNKVVLGAQAVLADGALLGFTGAHNLAACARVHAVPVLVVAGLYKFSPLYAFNQDTLNAHNRPSEILSYGELSSTKVHIYNPAFDYVPSTYIHLFITNVGTYHPSYVYRLLSESYDQADLDI